MKKRMFVCFFIFTVSVFHLSIPNVVFGQSLKGLGLDNYDEIFRNPEVNEFFPDFLRALQEPTNHFYVTDPNFVKSFVNDPRQIWAFYPEADQSLVVLLTVDDQFRKLFNDAAFHAVLKNTKKIGDLAELIDKLEPHSSDLTCPLPEESEPRRATALRIVSESNQSGEIGKPLSQPFVVGVLDQDGKPLQGVAVTFSVPPRNGRLSETGDTTDVYGQARTTLTLGDRAGRYSVTARAAGIAQPQTFTATAVAPPPKEPEPEPVVSMPLSTVESPLPPMYWIEGNTIYHRPTGGGKDIFLKPEDGTLTGGLAVDTVGGKVYWTEEKSWTETGRTGEGQIQSANLDGSTIQTIKKITAVPWDIALGARKKNAEDRRLYWTNSSGRIQHIKVSGGRVETLFELNRPKHIAFDTEKERLHWTDADGIWSTAPEGSKPMKWRSHLPDDLGDDLDKVRGIAVFDDVVYWTEQTRNGGKVRAMNRKGLGDKKLLAGLEEIIPGGIAVDAVGQKVYWTTSRGEVQSALTDAQTVTIRGGVPTGIALGGTARVSASAGAPSIIPVVSAENALLANYPNPFNPETWIPYQLSASADVSVSIYSVNGHLVRHLDLGHQSAGVYQSRSRAAYWDGRNAFGERVASGLYFYTLTAGDFTATRKMLIRK